MSIMEDPFQLFLNSDMDFTSFTDFHSKPIDTVLLEGMHVPSLHAFDQVDYDININNHQQHYPVTTTTDQQQLIFNQEIPGFDHPSSPFTIMSSSPKSSNASIQMVSSPEHRPMASPATTSINTTLLIPSVPLEFPITDISNTTSHHELNQVPSTVTTTTTNTTTAPSTKTETSPSSTTRTTTTKKTSSTGKPKGRKRRTAQDLPYAPNLLNLNLAPSKRNTRITHNHNNNNGNSSSNSSNSTQRSPTPFRCDFPGCEKTFTRPYNLKSHRRTHTAERPFECNVCSKRFARQHDRNRHTKLHFGIKPYICHLCNKAFARQDALNRHQRPDSNKLVGGASYPISSCASTGHRQRQPRKKNNANSNNKSA